MNLCTTCKQDFGFGSVSAFDAHRVGKHEYTFREGLAMTPSREDGRRCLDEDEMIEKGFARSSRGSWSLGKDLSRSWEALRTKSTPRNGAV